ALQRISLSQAAAPCRFDLSRTRDSIGAAGGRLSVSLTTLNGCAWTASSGSAWITIQSGQSGNANATVVVSVAPNTGEARVGEARRRGNRRRRRRIEQLHPCNQGRERQ